jgi:hypothetical protein
MGTLRHFDIRKMKADYGLQNFVETGTWLGDAVEYALAEGYTPCFSVELKDEFWKAAVARFAGRPASILHGSSEDKLPEILRQLDSNPTLWWLDAHLQDFYGLPADMVNRFPLERELELLCQMRDISRDVILIDDLRIYEAGPFECGPCPKEHANPKGTAFIEMLLPKHKMTKDYRNEGYIICEPVK